MPAFEVLLPVGALALYLYDSVHGLYGDELLLQRVRLGWRTSAGSGLLFAGRRPCLPRPLAPDAPVFRVRWDRPQDGGTLGSAEIQAMTVPLRLPGLLVRAQLVLLVLALPVVSIALGAGRVLLAVFALYYLLSFVVLLLLVRARAVLRLTGRQLGLLAFESIACAPFALNLLRKVGLLQSGRLRWAEIAATTFNDRERRELGEAIDASIAAALALEDGGTPRAARLVELRNMLGARLGVAGSR